MGRKKATVKAPRFAFKEMVTAFRTCDIEFKPTCNIFHRILHRLSMLSPLIIHNNFTPLPADLVGSLYSPDIICRYSDSEFVTFYEANIADTVEEALAKMLIELLTYSAYNTHVGARGVFYDRVHFEVALNLTVRNPLTYIDKVEEAVGMYKDDPVNKNVLIGYAYSLIRFIQCDYQLNLYQVLVWNLRYRQIRKGSPD